MVEKVHSWIQYLGRDRKLGECKRSSQRIQKGILIGHGRCKMAKKRRRDIQKRRTTRMIYSKETIWMVRQAIWQGILEKIKKELETIEKGTSKRKKNFRNNSGERRKNQVERTGN